MRNYVLLIRNMWIYIYIIIHHCLLNILLGQRGKSSKTTIIRHGTLYPLDVSKQLLNEKIYTSRE